MNILPLIKEMSRKSEPLIESTYCISTEVLCSGSKDTDHVNEEDFNSLYRQIKISAGHTPAKGHMGAFEYGGRPLFLWGGTQAALCIW
jgi:hypothetical protein